jgi:hypothetical protein
MVFGLSTENARKWSPKGKTLQSKVLVRAKEDHPEGEQIGNIG